MAESNAPDYENIQGDIWPGLPKKYQIFWFFQITDAGIFKPSLGKLMDDKIITSSADAQNHRKKIHEVKTSQPGTLHELASVNIAFSFKGMQKLDKSKSRFRDDPFRKSMEGDMVNEGRDRINEWMDEFKAENNGVDGVLLICGTEDMVKETTNDLAKEYFSSIHGIKHVLTLDGNERPDKNKGHEHFGFLDAISQPRLAGFDTQCKKGDGNYQHMCRPGRIIIGHDGEMNNEPKSQHPPWAKDGSYLVVRKLKQYVPEFNKYLEEEAPKLSFNADQLGARLVGRWKSGAPVEKHPWKDFPADEKLNEFNYDVNDHKNCPFASHMRKTKPRSIVSDRDMNDIMRRGIPYGPEVGPDETTTQKDRGLMFLCYQSSIGNGFQFLKRSWVNLDTFPADKTEYTGGYNPGQDAIIGQLVSKPQKPSQKVLTTALVDGKNKHTTTSFLPFIQSNGGDYFFSPSLKLLAELGGKGITGKRKRTEDPSTDLAVIYSGVYDNGVYGQNEIIWASFPQGRKEGAPLHVLTTSSEGNAEKSKVPLSFLYDAINSDGRSFVTQGAEGNGKHEYWFSGTTRENGAKLGLVMTDKDGRSLAQYELNQVTKDTKINFKN